MKTHPLVIEAWGEDGEDLVSRGHHDPMTFLVACVRYLKIDGLFYREAETPVERRELLSCGQMFACGHQPMAVPCRTLRPIKHEWWRWLPPNKVGIGTEWEGMRYARVEQGPGAGVFPVTILRTGA